jgi:hypothetical protein
VGHRAVRYRLASSIFHQRSVLSSLDTETSFRPEALHCRARFIDRFEDGRDGVGIGSQAGRQEIEFE